jgi:hypothetical protein
MAAYLMVHVVGSLLANPQAAWRVAFRLELEFERTYGRPAPLAHRHHLPGSQPPEDENGSEPSPGLRNAVSGQVRLAPTY